MVVGGLWTTARLSLATWSRCVVSSTKSTTARRRPDLQIFQNCLPRYHTPIHYQMRSPSLLRRNLSRRVRVGRINLLQLEDGRALIPQNQNKDKKRNKKSEREIERSKCPLFGKSCLLRFRPTSQSH
mmetsp:Transcript_6863/g.18638  ORF Transcript_6863/g.18638 Transcript_6863/m.18638 type:complete len:127 (-) Transcript_6863:305-685(-)